MIGNLSISDLFPSKFLKTADIGDTDLVLTIESITLEDLGLGDKKENKPVLHFKETAKVLVLNKTNANAIAQLYGNQTANWIGKKIALFTTEVAFQGTTMLGIRVRVRPPLQLQQLDSEIPE